MYSQFELVTVERRRKQIVLLKVVYYVFLSLCLVVSRTLFANLFVR